MVFNETSFAQVINTDRDFGTDEKKIMVFNETCFAKVINTDRDKKHKITSSKRYHATPAWVEPS